MKEEEIFDRGEVLSRDLVFFPFLVYRVVGAHTFGIILV